jgi:hypothetical protein
MPPFVRYRKDIGVSIIRVTILPISLILGEFGAMTICHLNGVGGADAIPIGRNMNNWPWR